MRQLPPCPALLLSPWQSLTRQLISVLSNPNLQVKGFTGADELAGALKGAELVVIPAGALH